MDEELREPLMLDLVKRLAYPEDYAEDFNALSAKAKWLLEELGKEPVREGHN